MKEIAIGDEFGRLTVRRLLSGAEAQELGSSQTGTHALCDCSCGGEKLVPVGDIRRLRIPSCGCMRRATSKEHQQRIREGRGDPRQHRMRRMRRDPYPVCECHGRIDCIDQYALAQHAP